MKINVELIKNYPIDSNCFVIYEDTDCLIIDPGTKDCKNLLSFLTEHKLVPNYIILTHEHFDHVLGVNKLLELFECTIICSEICLNNIADKKKNLSVFQDQIGFEIVPKKVRLVSDEVLELGNYTIEFKLTPGHSLGSVSFWLNNMFFSGDVFIKDTKTVTKLPGGSKKLLIETINDLKSLFKEENMVVYPGHGDIFLFNEIDFSKII